MKSLTELLAAWEEGRLTPADVTALKQRLADPAARAELVDDLLLAEALYGILRAEAEQALAVMPAPGLQPVSLRTIAPASKPDRAAVAEAERPQASLGRRERRERGHASAHGLRRFLPWLVWREVKVPLRLAVGFAVLFVLLTLYVFQTAPLGRLSEVRGQVAVVHGGGERAAQPGQTLAVGDVVRVPEGGAALVAWRSERTGFELSPHTEIEVLGRFFGKQFALRRGHLQATVAGQPVGRPMVLRTPQAQATVVGTRFSLAVATNATRIEVMEGAVAVRPRPGASKSVSAPTTVRPGQYAVVTPSATTAVGFSTGYAIWEALELPPASPPFADPNGKVVSRDYITNVAAVGRLAQFARSPTNRYEERIRGYLIPAMTGDGTFWIDSGARSELRLSTDDDPRHRQRIASVPLLPLAPAGGPSRSAALAWNLVLAEPPSPGDAGAPGSLTLGGTFSRHPDQKSAPIRLVAGQRYFFEVVHDFDPDDLVIVAWARPVAPGRIEPGWIEGATLAPYFELSPTTTAASPR